MAGAGEGGDGCRLKRDLVENRIREAEEEVAGLLRVSPAVRLRVSGWLVGWLVLWVRWLVG